MFTKSVCGGLSVCKMMKAKRKDVGKTRCYISWSFLVWHYACGLIRSLANSSVFHNNELGDARDMLMFVKQMQRKREILGTRRGEHFFRAHVDVWTTAENETRSSHALRRHGDQQARGMPVAWNYVLA